ICLLTGSTDQLIIMSALGAVVMYIISMLSLFQLRKIKPALKRPFKAPFYPVFPILALALSFICLIAIVYYNIEISIIFVGGFFIVFLIFKLTGTTIEVKDLT